VQILRDYFPDLDVFIIDDM